jgi:hypothetical protein
MRAAKAFVAKVMVFDKPIAASASETPYCFLL